MTVADFFNQLLKSQELTPEQRAELTEHRDEVEVVLREVFGQDPTIRYAGSKAKGTMNADSYDLDIACYFPNDCEKTIKEIYDETKAALSEHFTIEPKTSALRIKSLNGSDSPVDYHIDVVPGRFIVDSKDVYLHLASAEGGYIKTNLKTHIDHIKNSGQQDIIRLMKLWKVRNRLNFRTFVLELMVVHALKGTGATGNAKKVQEVLTFIRDNMTTVRLEDPANSDNVVTELLTSSEKLLAATLAGEAITRLEAVEEGEEDEKVGAWQWIFKEEATGKQARTSTPLIVRREPPKPWCNV